MWLEGNLLITHGNSHVFVELLRDFGYSKPGINLFIIWGQGSIDIVQRNGAFEYWEYPLSTMPAKYGIKYNTVYMFWTQGSIHIYIYHIYICNYIYDICTSSTHLHYPRLHPPKRQHYPTWTVRISQKCSKITLAQQIRSVLRWL